MYIFYRISDSSQKTIDSNSKIVNKIKPSYINKKSCFLNFYKVFSCEDIYIIADNVSDETYEW